MSIFTALWLLLGAGVLDWAQNDVGNQAFLSTISPENPIAGFSEPKHARRFVAIMFALVWIIPAVIGEYLTK